MVTKQWKNDEKNHVVCGVRGVWIERTSGSERIDHANGQAAVQKALVPYKMPS